MRDRDGTLVFVEVRARRSAAFGGERRAASKRRSLVFAAQFPEHAAVASALPGRRDRVR